MSLVKNISDEFDPEFIEKSNVFADLTPFSFLQWPSVDQLMALLPEDTNNAMGTKITMHSQYSGLPDPEMGYEERIYKTGVISTREKNWHDLFNAYIWCLFPMTKTLLNELHMKELKVQSGKKRTPARDAITHLDESGVIVVSTDPIFFQQLKNHQWQNIFVDRKNEWWSKVSCYVFGHGLYEKALNPFIGFTGKAFCILVEAGFFTLNKQAQYKKLDELLASQIRKNNSLADSTQLSPFPVLGVPGWYDDNNEPEFYENKRYFRPKRKS